MSEAPAPVGASLYPADGGAAAAEAALAATTTAPAGADSVAGAAGTDSVAAPAGTDTVAGTDTGTATEAGAAGTDSVAGAAGTDSITAESYTFTLPEGFTEDATLTGEARTAMLEAGVKPEKAQDLVNLFGKAVKASQDAATLAHQTEQQTWLQAINSMPEFQGPTRETSLQSIGKLFDEYGTPEAKAALDRGGIGNNPALVKMMHKIATALSEGAPAPAGRPAPSRNGAAKPTTVGGALYENEGRGPNAN